MVGNNKRLTIAFEELKRRGLAHSQQDVANKMCVNKSNFSKAMNGEPSDSFLRRFNAAYGGLFSDEWLTDGVGQMMAPAQSVGDISNSNVNDVNVNGKFVAESYNTLLKIVEANQKSTEKFQEQIDRLISLIEKK